MNTTPAVGRDRILDKLTSIVLKRHFNAGGIDYENWLGAVENRRVSLRSGSAAQFETGVNELLNGLNTSHAAFYRDVPKSFPSQHTVGATLKLVSVAGSSRWMFLDVFPDGAADRAGIRTGELFIDMDGSDPLEQPEPPRFKIGHTHRLTLRAAHNGSTREVEVAVPHLKATKQRPPMVEPQSVLVKPLGGDVGLLKVTYFPGALGLRFNRQIDEAVSSLIATGVRRLVLDLRGNIGGSLGFARLASHLCAGGLAVGHSLTPDRLRSGFTRAELPRVRMPATRVEAAITLARFAMRDKSLFLMTQSLGPKPFHGRVAVLVNEWTNSAGEIVAAFAQDQGIAKIVGRTTRGNVLGATNFNVGGGYWLRIPVFGWYTATGKLLEKVGVKPDIELNEIPEQLSSGSDEQLATAHDFLVHQ